LGWQGELGWMALTEREQAVAARVAIGMTNREIAQELHLATSTIKTHLTNTMLKLGVTNRTRVALVALRADSPAVREMTERVYPEAG
jgi:DNA-binding NarL/FixJ family response regulator